MDYDLDDIKVILAPCALIVCMVWDILLEVAQDYVKISSWIPKNLFVLSALTIEILGYIEIQKFNFLDPSSAKDLEVLVDNQLKMDAARLTMCVFLGCLLPGMAMAGTRGSWSNVAALFVSLSFHIGTEIYAMQNLYSSKVRSESGVWFVSSGVLLLLAASSLLLLLGAVILSGKLARDGVRSDIAEKLGKDVENGGHMRVSLKSELMESWVAVRAWKTLYFLGSSAFSPGAGIMVTICVVFMAAKVKGRSSLLHHHHGGGNLTFYLQCVFILVGWIIMLCRWFKTAFSCATSFEKARFIKIIGFLLQPAAVLVNPLCPNLAYFLLNPKDFRVRNILISFRLSLWNILISLSCIVLLLPLCVLILVISLLGFFCYICWYVSALVFGSKLSQKLWKIHSKSDLPNDEHSKYQSVLEPMYCNKEKIDTFWVVDKKSFARIKHSMDGGNKIQQSCPKLLSIMGSSKLAENQRLRPIERDQIRRGWMETMSSIFEAIADIEIGVDMEDAFEAYRETQDVLKFLDCPDNIILDSLNIFGTLNVVACATSIKCEGTMLDVERKLKQTSLEEKRERVEPEEQARVDNKLRGFREYMEQYDERASNSLLIRLDECSYNNLEELGEMLRTLVCHVNVSGLLEARGVILKYTKQWVRNIDERKIKRAIELAAKVSALLENLVEDRDILFTNL